jgi:cytochrome P450
MSKSIPNLLEKSDSIEDIAYRNRTESFIEMSTDERRKLADKQFSNSAILTSANLFRSDAHTILPTLLNQVLKYGPLVRFFKGNDMGVIVGDAQAIQHILVDHADCYQKTHNNIDIREVVGNSLFAISDTNEYRMHRRVIEPIFHLDLLKFMMNSFGGSILDLVDLWSKSPDNAVIDLKEHIFRLGVALRMKAFYSKKIELFPKIEDKHEDLAKYIMRIFLEGEKRIRNPFIKSIPRPGNTKFEKAVGKLIEISTEVVEKRLAEPDPSAF